MANLIRREVIETAKTMVIKIGTSVLSNDDDTLNVARIKTLVEQVNRVQQTGRKVVLVSSGAVGAGLGLLGLNQRPNDLPRLQAAAAVGQTHLIQLYNDCLAKHGYRAAQLLLTANDFRNRERYLNVRNTLNTLLEYPIVPIVNENDTVSISEIQFGDNDQLAAMVSNLLDDSILVVLSVIDGLFDGDPDSSSSRPIPLVEKWDAQLMSLATDNKSRRGKGGMQSKLRAVRKVTDVGESVIIANGRQDDVLDRILAGEEVGTLFLAQGTTIPAWKRWIGYTVDPSGWIEVDDGAKHALIANGRSLLAIGVTNVDGRFERGDVVSIRDTAGDHFARGLTNYDSRTAATILGKRSDELPKSSEQEVVHRDNLVILNS
jgi:glutamate 5-kinase